MNKICTSIEQSKKLIELGINRKTSDMFYWCGEDLRIGGYKAQDEEYDIPAWSLSALIKLMPERIKIGDELSFCLASKKSVLGFSFDYNFNESIFVADNLLDAAFEMVCWLLKNEKA